MGGYEPNWVDHTFTTGRTMRIRKHLPATWLSVQAAGQSDGAGATMAILAAGDTAPPELAGFAPAVVGTLVEAMFIKPRVVWDPDMAPEVEDPGDGSWPPVVPATDLLDDEIQEVMDIAFQGVAEAKRFRGDAPGDDGGGDSPGVGDAPQQRRRAATGNRRGAAGGSKARGKAA